MNYARAGFRRRATYLNSLSSAVLKQELAW